ncbi:tyrosine-type recombinase/integrase [Ralstonia solanacearum]|uniref:tyrosine-type recombinase/integrase n=1 Tax=Ralstonia solanacearum TaxID=305 RepID=UPI002E20329D|nr:tyrosine-type recombinase/integrase [Ralstonia solanacearum]
MVVYTEAKTFDRAQAASAWLKKREKELAQPGALETAKEKAPLLSEVIGRYLLESSRKLGRTKEQVLGAIRGHHSGACAAVKSAAALRELWPKPEVQPPDCRKLHVTSERCGDLGTPGVGLPADAAALADARIVLKKLGKTSKSRQRNRRPTLEELDLYMEHFSVGLKRGASSIPMPAIIAFAIFATRRQEEIATIRWEDLDDAGSRVLVREMKHPGEKIGNDTWCDLPPEALHIALAQPRTSDERIFPYNHRSISAAFTRAGHILGVEDLHFHDLRHEGTSRLFEMGWNIPHVATVTGHRSWSSLKRYTHVRHVGNRFEGWRWLSIVAPLPDEPVAK